MMIIHCLKPLETSQKNLQRANEATEKGWKSESEMRWRRKKVAAAHPIGCFHCCSGEKLMASVDYSPTPSALYPTIGLRQEMCNRFRITCSFMIHQVEMRFAQHWKNLFNPPTQTDIFHFLLFRNPGSRLLIQADSRIMDEAQRKLLR